MKQPRLRFYKFNNKDEWNTYILKDVTSPVSGNNGNVQGLPVLTISAAHGWMNQKDRFSQVIAGKQLKRYTLLKRGQLSYNHGNSKRAKYGCVFVLNNYKEALVPRIYHSFKSNDKSNPQFLNYLFSSRIPDRELRKMVTSSARNDGLLNINKKSFFSIHINIPSLLEQRFIGRFFAKLDKLISLQQSKLTLFKKLRKAYLQKLFPQKHESIPRIRFNGFNNKWNILRLGNIGKTKSGTGFPRKEQGGTKGVPFFKVSDINLPKNTILMKKSSNYVNNTQISERHWKPIVPTNGALIFAKVGAALMKNRKRIVTDKFLIDNNVMAYAFSNHWDRYFGLNYFSTIYLPKFAQMGALPSFNASSINSIKVKIPSLSEQQLIGNFFKTLDTGITLQKDKLRYLRKLKKAYLQKMFC